jgi:hypothetical protein
MKKKDLWVYAAILLLAGIVMSCQVNDNELGEDLLPPGDDVFLYHDTIIDIHAYPVTSSHIQTSDNSLSAEKLYLLGNWQDTIVGSAVTSVITQVNNNGQFLAGPNMEIDSIMFFLHVYDYVGNMSEQITIRVHEFTERIYMDSVYYSDYDMEGKYDPEPLVEKSFMPENESNLEFRITDQDFINKFLALEDSLYTSNDSIFKDFFNGFYITAESVSPEGSMARIQLSNEFSLLSIKYANDSTDVDTTAGMDFRWAQFSIDEFYCQKINIFEHNYSGTYLSGILDDETAQVPYCYVQGLSGVNTRFSFTSLQDWIDLSPVAVNSASLVFEVVPEEESGILYQNLPGRLMMGTILEDGSYQPIYDYVVLLSNSNSSEFGGYKKAESEGMFSDTTYTYRFNVTLHLQAMLDGTKTDNDFILKVSDGLVSPKISKLWGNIPANNQRIRLEIVYLKL